MTKELIKKLDDIYNTLKIPPQISTYQYQYKKITAIETKKLNDEIYDGREKKEDIPKIQVLTAKFKNNIIIMNTNIGTFTMENPKNIPIHLKQKYTIEEFYNLLKTNDFNTTQSYFKNRDGYYVNDKNEFFLNHFFNAYYWYKMVTEDVKRLYLYLSYTALSYNIEVSAPTENLIPIEVVTSPNFNNYAHTQEIPPYSRYLPLIKRIQNRFENICPLENNPYLIFTIAIYTNEPKYLPYIEENLNLFNLPFTIIGNLFLSNPSFSACSVKTSLSFSTLSLGTSSRFRYNGFIAAACIAISLASSASCPSIITTVTIFPPI